MLTYLINNYVRDYKICNKMAFIYCTSTGAEYVETEARWFRVMGNKDPSK